MSAGRIYDMMAPVRHMASSNQPNSRDGGDGTAFAPSVPDHELIRCIGRGAYGDVWLARNVLGTLRAVKVVYRKSFRDEHTYEREFRGIQQFEPISRAYEGFLDILQAGRNDAAGYYFYVMELADDANAEVSRQKAESPDQTAGVEPRLTRALYRSDSYGPKTLYRELKQRGRLPAMECVQLGLNLTLALGHLHRHGLIHRDIKPANIIFVQGFPKLADIGLVTSFDDTCSFVGTEGFVAPEGPTSPRADLFSLGKVLYEASTGKDRKDFPEPPTGLGETRDAPEVAELNAVILRACATDPEDRYQNAEEFHADLAWLNSGKSVRWKRLVERRLAFARKAGAVVGVLAALAVGGYVYQRHQTREAVRLQRHAEDLAARIQIQNAEHLFARGDSALALAHLAQVLRRHPEHRVAAERILAALNQRSFPRLALQPLVHEAKVHLRARLSPARLSSDGQRIVAAAGDHTVRLWAVPTGEELMPPHQHKGPVLWVEFSPDEQQLLTASADGTACILDAQAGKPVIPALQHGDPVYAARFDPTGDLVATAADSQARIYRAETGLLLGRLPHDDQVNFVEFSPDGQWLATASEDGTVRLWDARSGQLLRRCAASGRAALVRFSPDGQWLAATVQSAAGGAWQVEVWEVESGRPLPGPLLHQNRLYTLDFSPDSQRLVTATANNAAVVWRVATGRELFRLPHSAIVYSAVFSPDGERILTASVDHTARLWSASTGDPVSEAMHHDGRVIHAAFSRDGNRALTVGWEDKAVKLWAIGPDRPQATTLPHDAWVVSAEFGRGDAEMVTTTSAVARTANEINRWGLLNARQIAMVWDVGTGTPKFAPAFPGGAEALAVHLGLPGPRALIVQRLDQSAFATNAWVSNLATGEPTGDAIQHEAGITSARFSADGLKLATGSSDGEVRICDAQRGTPLTPRLTHRGPVNSLRFSPNTQMLITASADHTAAIWDTGTGSPLAVPLEHDDGVWFADFSPQGDRVVTVSLDHTARVWSTNGTPLFKFPHGAAVEHAEFSPDGTKLATASGDQTARIWSLANGKPLTELRHAQLVMTVRFSANGLRVITASMDGTAQVWDVATGLRLGDPFRHDDTVVSASFSRDGRWAITASLDRTARIWEVPVASHPVAAWLPELAEAVGGLRLNTDGILAPVPWTEYAQLETNLTQSTNTDPWNQWAKRFFEECEGVSQ